MTISQWSQKCEKLLETCSDAASHSKSTHTQGETAPHETQGIYPSCLLLGQKETYEALEMEKGRFRVWQRRMIRASYPESFSMLHSVPSTDQPVQHALLQALDILSARLERVHDILTGTAPNRNTTIAVTLTEQNEETKSELSELILGTRSSITTLYRYVELIRPQRIEDSGIDFADGHYSHSLDAEETESEVQPWLEKRWEYVQLRKSRQEPTIEVHENIIPDQQSRQQISQQLSNPPGAIYGEETDDLARDIPIERISLDDLAPDVVSVDDFESYFLEPDLTTMIEEDKQWILTGSYNYAPDGLLQLGQILAEPVEPWSKVSSTGPLELPRGTTEHLTSSTMTNDDIEHQFSAWVNSRQKRSFFKKRVKVQEPREHVWRFNRLESHTASPSLEYVKATLKDNDLFKRLRRNPFMSSLYMVTGLRVARGVNVRRNRQSPLEMGVIGSNSGPAVGIQVDTSQLESEVPDVVPDFIFAYRLNEIRCGLLSRKVTQKPFKRGRGLKDYLHGE
ncbi:hypothetical protein FSST1_012549 [Fusarium sambucinum]